MMTSKKITTVLFDLDGTLLPMDQDVFAKTYFNLLAKNLAPHGYDPQAFVAGLWNSIKTMFVNDGRATNEVVFWQSFAETFGERVYGDKIWFDTFYAEHFDEVAASCGYDERAAQVIALCRDKGLVTALATNPIFPRIATEKRMRWAGLNPADFALYTTYEDSRYCKPNLNYYQEILSQLGVCGEECLMVGNDVSEDMVAEKLGMRVFLLTDCMIHKNKDVDITKYPQGGFDDLLSYIERLD